MKIRRKRGGQRTDWSFLLHQSFLGSTDIYNSQGTSYSVTQRSSPMNHMIAKLPSSPVCSSCAGPSLLDLRLTVRERTGDARGWQKVAGSP